MDVKRLKPKGYSSLSKQHPSEILYERHYPNDKQGELT